MPDKGRDPTGGVGLPLPELRLATGQVLSGQAACDGLKVIRTRLLTALPLDLYKTLRDQRGELQAVGLGDQEAGG